MPQRHLPWKKREARTTSTSSKWVHHGLGSSPIHRAPVGIGAGALRAVFGMALGPSGGSWLALGALPRPNMAFLAHPRASHSPLMASSGDLLALTVSHWGKSKDQVNFGGLGTREGSERGESLVSSTPSGTALTRLQVALATVPAHTSPPTVDTSYLQAAGRATRPRALPARALSFRDHHLPCTCGAPRSFDLTQTQSQPRSHAR